MLWSFEVLDPTQLLVLFFTSLSPSLSYFSCLLVCFIFFSCVDATSPYSRLSGGPGRKFHIPILRAYKHGLPGDIHLKMQ